MMRSHANPAGTREQEQKYFDAYVGERGDFNPFTDRGWDVLRSGFEKLMSEEGVREKSLDVLDVGCGTGQSLKLYQHRSASFVGVDLSVKAIALAKARFPNRHWIVGDATRLPFADASFDLVAFSSVLHHIPDFLPAAHEAFRLLRPGGTAFAYDPNLAHPAMALLRWPRSPFYTAAGVSPNEAPLLPRHLRRQFRKAGFLDLDQLCVAGLTYRTIAPPLLRPFLGIYNLLDRVMASIGFGR
ncbi:MAG: class I SAM-dependent methyltransferase, partial [Phycisphaerae bacterium]|nr:class I SAM-dependent methyltransferase [Phycisphaerae bacterium]